MKIVAEEIKNAIESWKAKAIKSLEATCLDNSLDF